MANQKYPVSKDANVNLTSEHKKSNDTTLGAWLDNHATSEGDVSTVAKAITTSLSTDSVNHNLDVLVQANYEGPGALDTTQATGGNSFTKHAYFVNTESGSIEQEVGTKIASGTTLATVTTTITKNKNGGISSIDSASTSGDKGDTAVTSIVMASYNSGGKNYTSDSASGTSNVGDNNGANVKVQLTVGSADGSISSSVSVKAKKDLFVTPSATTDGRVKMLVEGQAPDHAVVMASNTVTGSGNGIYHGTVRNVVISGATRSANVPAKTVTLKPVEDGTFYIGTGYRKYFAGTIALTEGPTTDAEFQSILTQLAGDKARTSNANVVVKANGKVTNGTVTIATTGSNVISKKYFFVAIPADKKLTAFAHKDAGMSEQKDVIRQITYSTVTTVNVNGANSKFPTAYKVYMFANSLNKVIELSASEYVKFTIADA